MARIVLVGEESGEDLHEREQIFLQIFRYPVVCRHSAVLWESSRRISGAITSNSIEDTHDIHSRRQWVTMHWRRCRNWDHLHIWSGMGA
jgi:hypothetical protein